MIIILTNPFLRFQLFRYIKIYQSSKKGKKNNYLPLNNSLPPLTSTPNVFHPLYTSNSIFFFSFFFLMMVKLRSFNNISTYTYFQT